MERGLVFRNTLSRMSHFFILHLAFFISHVAFLSRMSHFFYLACRIVISHVAFFISHVAFFISHDAFFLSRMSHFYLASRIFYLASRIFFISHLVFLCRIYLQKCFSSPTKSHLECPLQASVHYVFHSILVLFDKSIIIN